MWARNCAMVSNWKLESSRTFQPSAREPSTMAVTGVPMLPPTCTGTPAARRMWPTRLVVVVLPFDPVMPMVRLFRKGPASSTSPTTRSPRLRAWSSGARSAGTSGESTIRSHPSNTSGVCRANGTFRRASNSRASPSSSSGFRSVARTAAPWRTSSSTDARPDFFIPTTSALAPFRRMSSQLQSGQREQRHHQPGDPEARDDLRFRPPQRLEMMVQRGHLENPFAAQLVAAHLEDDGKRLQHVNAADEYQQHLLLDEHRDHRHGAAQPEGSHIAHEDFRRVRVVPEEAHGGAGQRAAENGQFRGVRIARQLQVFGQLRVPAGIRQKSS